MRRPDPPPAQLTERPFGRAAGLDLTTRGRLRGSAYVRMTRGAYWTAGHEIHHGHRIEAMRAVLPERSVLGGLSAAWVLGVPWAGSGDPVEIVLPADQRVRRRDGLVVRGDLLLPGEWVETDAGRVTSAARTAFDLGRRGSAGTAVSAMDAVLRATGTERDEVLAVAEAHPGVRGLRRFEEAVVHVDPRSESPRESRLRVVLAAAGLPAPVPQHVVSDAVGAFVARLDLAWPDRRAGVEYDGDQHREQRVHSRDLDRHNRLRLAGWTVLQVDAAQLRDPVRVVAAVRALLRTNPPQNPRRV